MESAPLFAGTTESRERNGWKGESSDNWRKLGGDGADVTLSGSSFQTRAAVTDAVGKRVRQTISDDDAERRRPRKSEAVRNYTRQITKMNFTTYIIPATDRGPRHFDFPNCTAAERSIFPHGFTGWPNDRADCNWNVQPPVANCGNTNWLTTCDHNDERRRNSVWLLFRSTTQARHSGSLSLRS